MPDDSPVVSRTAHDEEATRGDLLPPSVPIIILASACWETATPVNVHQIARRFAARGHRVLFVESTGVRAPSAGSAHDLRRIARRIFGSWRTRRAKPFRGGGETNLFVIAPLALPGAGPPRLRRWSMRRIARSVRRAMQALQIADGEAILWAFLPTYLEALRRIPGSARVYHCVDHYAANPGADADWLEELERAICAEVDLVIATSPVLAERLAGYGNDIALMPNVADVTLFSRAVTENLPEPDALRNIARPRAVYVGNLARYRIDLDLLDTVIRALPEVAFIFIGVIGAGDPGSDARDDDALERLRARPNVHFIGPQPQHELPAFLRHVDVALIPFLDNAHTRGSLPLKLWEYAAAGLPIVARDLPNFSGAAAEGVVRPAHDAQGFVDAIDVAITEDPKLRTERVEAARRHDWPARIDELSRRLNAIRRSPEIG